MTQNTANLHFLCRFLYSSTKEYEDAFTLYAGARNVDIIKSFSYMHKAWNSLWYIDMMLNQPWVIEANSEKNKIPGINTVLNYVDARESETKALEGYNPELASSLFGNLQKAYKKHPFVLNLELLRKIRNLDQHAYLEPSSKKRMHLIHTLNPYLIANVRNYLEVYKDLKEKVEDNCKSHLKSSRCKRLALLRPAQIAADIIIPQSMLSIDNPNLESLLKSVSIFIAEQKEKVENEMENNSSTDLEGDVILELLSEYETDAQIIKYIKEIERVFSEGIFKNSNDIKFLRLEKGSYYIDQDKDTLRKKEELQKDTGYDLTNKSKNALLNREPIEKFLKLFKYDNPGKVIENLNNNGYEYDLRPKDIKNIIGEIGSRLGWDQNKEDNIFMYRLNGKFHYSVDLEYFISEHLRYDSHWKFYGIKIPPKKSF